VLFICLESVYTAIWSPVLLIKLWKNELFWMMQKFNTYKHKILYYF
jgi:hypothetical protein